MSCFPLVFSLASLAAAAPLTTLLILAGVFGAAVGSFLNVVIHRLPREQSITSPRSHCVNCGRTIRAYDNIPIISYLILGGRCRLCNASISVRYPAVEALTVLLFVAAAWRDGLSLELPFELVFIATLIALAFIDAEHMLLPNAITYPGIALALIARIALPYLVGSPHFEDLPSLQHSLGSNFPTVGASLIGALIGALVGGGSLWLMGWLWEKFRGVEAMGLGDVKMMLMVGAYLGWRLAVLTIFLAVLSGSVIGVTLMLYRGQRDLQMRVPFGVFLSIGAIASLFVGARLVEWYLSQFLFFNL
jgi:leader peptidase (prepilin peptidase) / N-methyltransferase